MVLFAGAAAPQTVQAQTPEAEVRTVIDQLFDGMRAGDSTMVRTAFHPSADLHTTAFREGRPFLHKGSIDRFVTAVGTPHDEVWDERIWDVEISVDDNLASAWVPYAFFAGDQFSHCGVNAMQLVNGKDGWQILNLTDSRRREGCDLPKWD